MRKKSFIPPPKSQEFQLPESDYQWLLNYIRLNYPEFTSHRFQIEISRLADGSLESITYKVMPKGMNSYAKRFILSKYDPVSFRIYSEGAISDISHMILKDIANPLGELLRRLL